MNQQQNLLVKTLPEVYPPSEDTWFLAEVIDQHLREKNFLRNSALITNGLICEVGVGTGYISIFLATKYPQITVIGTDISPIAIALSYENALQLIPENYLHFCCTSLLNCFNANTFNADVIFFNPPYVRTPLEEFYNPPSPIVRAWSGGQNGIQTILTFLDELLEFRFESAFFLSSSLNENENFINAYESQLEVSEVARRQIEDEKLICYKVSKLEL